MSTEQGNRPTQPDRHIQPDRSAQPEWIITASQLREELGASPAPVLVDVREPEEHEESRIDGSKLIPLGQLQRRALKELHPGDDIVLYCAHGIRSLQAVRILQILGFEKLRSLAGGIEAWHERAEG